MSDQLVFQINTPAPSSVDAISSRGSKIDALAGSLAAIDGVYDNISGEDTIGTVAADLLGANYTGQVGGNIANVNIVAGMNADIATVIGISPDIEEVADISAEVSIVAENIDAIAALVAPEWSAIQNKPDLATAAELTALADASRNASQLDTGEVDPRLLPTVQSLLPEGFDDRDVSGVFNPLNGSLLSDVSWLVNNGEDVEILIAANGMRHWRTGLTRPERGAWEFALETTVTGADASAGAIISIGDGDGASGDRRFYSYLGNSFIGILNNSNAVVSGGVVAGMTYGENERVSLRLFVREDSTGWLTASKADGTEHTIALTDVPAGSVGFAWRRPITGKVHALKRIAVSGVMENRLSDVESAVSVTIEDRLTAIESAVVVSSTPNFITYHVLPDSTPSRNPKGFTNTGIDRITRGSYAGCWIIGDDGRLVEGDSSPLDGKWHIVTPDFRKILFTYDIGSANSVQGVAVDTSGASDTVWVAISTDRKIRHYDLDGTEITADVFDWTAAGYNGNPNGLAYDPVNSSLWVSTIGSTTVRRILTDPAASPRLFDTHTVALGMDQLHYDSTRQLLYYSVGGNGSNGNVGLYRVATTTVTTGYGPLQFAQAIEGVFVDRDNRELIIMSDGGFHDAASPAQNIALRYSVPLLT